MPLSVNAKAQLASLAKGGDIFAKSILKGSREVSISLGTETSNAIKVTGQVIDGFGNPLLGTFDVVLTSIPASGAGTMTDGGYGTVKAGSASKQLWMQTDTLGRFQADVLNAVAEVNLVQAVVNNGDTTLTVLTFA